MKIEFIKSPSPGTMAILARRMANGTLCEHPPGAVGLVQGQLAEMLMAADIAEKAAQVAVEEVRGICPQHITMIAVFGDIAAVEAALKAIQQHFNCGP
ncbi:BMC domain-containing protein [Zhaonella formicivorans]|uniref:BMC domain-containing protein n=1 Tax=Zhaonella formicivorans TaxID=2528593 RepID=UPI0010E104A0|nr:BMC domain-containing protein [Zhaonella formicivorans]